MPATCTGGRLHRGSGVIKLSEQLACPVWAMPQVPMVAEEGGHLAAGVCSHSTVLGLCCLLPAQLCRIVFSMDALWISIPFLQTPCRLQKRAPRRRPVALFDDPSSSSSSDGASSNAAPPQQQGSRILNPIFPEPQRGAVAGPLPVQTQRGVPTFKPAIADPPCPQCGGTGKVTCGDCRCGSGCRGGGSWHWQPGSCTGAGEPARPACLLKAGRH